MAAALPNTAFALRIHAEHMVRVTACDRDGAQTADALAHGDHTEDDTTAKQ